MGYFQEFVNLDFSCLSCLRSKVTTSKSGSLAFFEVIVYDLSVLFFHLLISWLQSPSTVILEKRKIKAVTVSTFYPSICHEVVVLDGQTVETVADFILGGSKITADGDCSHDIKNAYSLEEKL